MTVIFLVLGAIALAAYFASRSRHSHQNDPSGFAPGQTTALPERPVQVRGFKMGGVDTKEPAEVMVSVAGKRARSIKIPTSVYGIDYTDASGTPSQRVIRVKSIEDAGYSCYLHSYCYLASDDRMFRTDRIKTLYDHRTGEIINNPVEYFKKFSESFTQQVDHEAVMRLCEAGCMGLLYLAKEDRDLSDVEEAIILDYIAERIITPPKAMHKAQWSKDAMLLWLRAAVPQPNDFVPVINSWPKSGGERRLFKKYAEKIVSADGVVTEQEKLRANEMLVEIVSSQ